MRDKNNGKSQIEKLIELANELEKREHALSQESEQLDKLRSSLNERESRLHAAPAGLQAVKSEALLRQRPLIPPPHQPAARREIPASPRPVPAAKPADSAAQTVTEINEILRSIFWDYANSVHLISSQMSTVTAAMMCAAVTCVLENQGFNAREVFFEEMEKTLKGGGFGSACATPPQYARPAAAQSPAARPVIVPGAPDLGAAEGDAPANTAQGAAQQAPPPPDDSILRIDSPEAFYKLGEYGFRNDETITRVALPEGVELLPGSFFYGCRSLEEVWLPDSLREIGPYAFYGCEKLTGAHLGEASQLREIGEYAFAMCGAMQTLRIPSKVETLGTSVFRFCSSLKKLSFDKDGSLRSIGSHLLQNCAALEKLRLPDGITVIPTSMFYGCASLKKVVARGVDTIEDYAFYGDENLRTVRIRAKKAIAPQAFEGCDPSLEIEYLNY